MDPAIREVFKRPFAEQVAFFRAKLGNQVPTARWTDLWKSQHDTAFMVAGAQKADLLADLARAVDGAIAEGKSIGWFRANFDEIIGKHGWDYTGERNWRTGVIYQTNVSTSYAAGREAQLREGGYAYRMYKHSDSVMHPRPQHLAWDGLTLPSNHAFWATHSPPNGWGCKCRVVGIRDAAAARRLGGKWGVEPPPGWDAIDAKTGEEAGIDKGWGYQPGASVARGVQPSYRDAPPKGRPALTRPVCPDGGASFAAVRCPGPPPRPRPFDPARLLPDGKRPEWYVSAFLEQFGADIGKPVMFDDVNGEKLLISDALFLDTARSAKAGAPVYKSMKHGRHRYLAMLAETLKYPQEKWDAWEYIGARDEMARRVRYLAWWNLETDDKTGLSVFEWVPKKWWAGVTTFVPEFPDADDLDAYVASQRHGIRRWPK